MMRALLLGLLLLLLVPAGVRADEDVDVSARKALDDAWLVRTLRFALRRARAGVGETKDVGVYLGRGVFPPSGLAVVRRFDEAKRPPRLLFGDDVTETGLKGLRLLVVPGGWAPSQLAGMGEAGTKALKTFVASGGRYLGICAGGYLVCKTVVWAGGTFPYPIGLVEGAARGPVPGRAPWPKAEVFELAVEGLGTRRSLYAGGAAYEVSGATVLARYPGGRPAAIEAKHGRGRVLLTGAHVEFRERSDLDLLEENGWATGLEPGDDSVWKAFLKRLE